MVTKKLNKKLKSIFKNYKDPNEYARIIAELNKLYIENLKQLPNEYFAQK